MHDALCDAKNTTELFAIVRGEKRCNEVLGSVMEVHMKNKKVMKALKIVLSICKIIFSLSIVIGVWKDIHD